MAEWVDFDDVKAAIDKCSKHTVLEFYETMYEMVEVNELERRIDGLKKLTIPAEED